MQPGRGNGSEWGGRRGGGARNSSRGHGNNYRQQRASPTTPSPFSEKKARGGRSRAKRVYQDYISQEDARKGLQDGTLFSGKIRINVRSRSTAFVTADGGVLPSDIFLDTEKARNRALEGDLVAIRLSPVTDWKPMKRSLDRELGSIVDAVDKLSVADSKKAGETKDNHEDHAENGAGGPKQPTNGVPVATSHIRQAWEEGGGVASAVATETELWRPSPKVIRGAEVNSEVASLCPEGVLALQGNLQPVGKVVCILEEKTRAEHMGSLVVSNGDGRLSDKDSYVMFHPADRRVPHMLISLRELPSLFLDNPGKYSKSIFMARLKPTWLSSSKLPWGERVRFIGEAGEIHAETEAVLEGHKVNHGDFPRTVLRSLEEFLPGEREPGMDPGVNVRGSKWKIPEDEVARRRDLRNERIFTIDPTTARDLDDALSITPLGNGTFEIGVHIADVTYFLKPNSDLDREARRRGTTVYLVQKALPMLPPLLCEELCSLNPGVDRLAYSCVWKMNRDGTMVDEPAWFGRTVIRSCAKLDYTTAQHMIEGTIRPGDPSSITPDLWDLHRQPSGFTCDEVCKDVLLLHALAKERRAKRFESGALSLNTPKLTFELDENGNPISFGSYPIRDSNRLVEEYMLLANYLVAQKTMNGAGDRALLRWHPPPCDGGLASLKEDLATRDIGIDIESSGSIHASLKRLRANIEDEGLVQALTMMVTIPMKTAGYVTAGATCSWRHYALNIPIYTHFTSPIRRYADVMVHRILTAALGGPEMVEKTYSVTDVEKTAQHCNEMRFAAKNAQERCDLVYLAVYLRSNPLEAEAVVVSLGSRAFTVNVPLLGISSTVYLDKIPDIKVMHDELGSPLHLQATSTVTHDWTTTTIELLSKVIVRCAVADGSGPINVQVYFVRPVAPTRDRRP